MTAFRPCSKSTNVPFGHSRLAQLLASDQIAWPLQQLHQHFQGLFLQADQHARLAQLTRLRIEFEDAESKRTARWRGDVCHRHTRQDRPS